MKRLKRQRAVQLKHIVEGGKKSSNKSHVQRSSSVVSPETMVTDISDDEFNDDVEEHFKTGTRESNRQSAKQTEDKKIDQENKKMIDQEEEMSTDTTTEPKQQSNQSLDIQHGDENNVSRDTESTPVQKFIDDTEQASEDGIKHGNDSNGNQETESTPVQKFVDKTEDASEDGLQKNELRNRKYEGNLKDKAPIRNNTSFSQDPLKPQKPAYQDSKDRDAKCIEIMAANIQEEDATDNLVSEWQMVGKVINYFMMWLFIIAITFTFLILFGPVLFSEPDDEF